MKSMNFKIELEVKRHFLKLIRLGTAQKEGVTRNIDSEAVTRKEGENTKGSSTMKGN